MPQMMPMYWLLMATKTLFLLMIIITFLYFSPPTMITPNNNIITQMNKIYYWNWKW